MVVSVNEPSNMVAGASSCSAPESGLDEVRQTASLQEATRLITALAPAALVAEAGSRTWFIDCQRMARC